MIQLENIHLCNMLAALKGMRNPYDSWDKSDTKIVHNIDKIELYNIPNSEHSILYNAFFDEKYYYLTNYYKKHENNSDKDNQINIISVESNNTNSEILKSVTTDYIIKIGPEDLKLARTLARAGSEHGKFDRMIIVSFDLTAPFDFWKQFDTYKVGTVADSCSTMHTVTRTDFIWNKTFAIDGLREKDIEFIKKACEYYNDILHDETLNKKEKTKILSKTNMLGFLQKRTITLNYRVLYAQYMQRKGHLLKEWQEYRDFIENLPYFAAIYLEDYKNLNKES